MEAKSAIYSQSELFDKAAECDRLMSLSKDEVNKSAWRQVREMWIALANESQSSSGMVLTEEMAKVADIQADLIAGADRHPD